MQHKHGKSLSLEYLNEASRLNKLNCLSILKDYIDMETGEFIKELPPSMKQNFFRDGILIKQMRSIDKPYHRRSIVQINGATRSTGNYLILSPESKALLGIKEKPNVEFIK